MPAQPLSGSRVVLVDGCRTPFLRSQTDFADMPSYQLGAMAVAGLLHHSRLDPALIDRLIMGTVVAEPRTSNLAREVALSVGLPQSLPAHTVTAACTSSNVAIASAVEAIAAGTADIVIAGGAETLSDVPIRFSRALRKRLIASQKARGPADYLKLLSGLGMRDLAPDMPAIAEFSTGHTMGESAERLAKRVGISRADQDAFALSSHRRAAAATERGYLQAQMVPALVPPRFTPLRLDNGIRGDSSPEKLASLPPVFDRRFGTVSAGNSSFLTDGAAVVLLMSEKRARELGYEPLAEISSLAMAATDPHEELLMGPAYAIPQALDAAGVTLDQVGVFELHEAFAAQMLANLRLLADKSFAREKLGRDREVGEIPSDKLNAWGGSLSIGHPFGATGARLLMTAAQRMKQENAEWGLISACAAGALGHAMTLRRI
ncbi:3-ketoacyl-CoA thiolase [compost metagenome]